VRSPSDPAAASAVRRFQGVTILSWGVKIAVILAVLVILKMTGVL
jgi:hypothetical protein